MRASELSDSGFWTLRGPGLPYMVQKEACRFSASPKSHIHLVNECARGRAEAQKCLSSGRSGIRDPGPMQGVLGDCADEKGDRTLCEVKMRYTCSNIQDPKAAPVPRELSERPNFQGPSIRRQPAYLLSRSKPTRSARPESSLQVPRQSEEIEGESASPRSEGVQGGKRGVVRGPRSAVPLHNES